MIDMSDFQDKVIEAFRQQLAAEYAEAWKAVKTGRVIPLDRLQQSLERDKP
jgi:hypothetical protein